MMFATITRAAGALLLVAGLAGCIDMTMEIEVLDEQTGNGIFIKSMDREFYDMSLQQGGNDFCEDDEELTVTETVATCRSEETGKFADLLSADDDDPAPTVTNVGPGLVRVSFPTTNIADELSEDADDPQAMAMMQQMLKGHFLTFKASGGLVVETNMELADDEMSASFSVPLLALVTGDINVTEDSYAIIQLQ